MGRHCCYLHDYCLGSRASEFGVQPAESRGPVARVNRDGRDGGPGIVHRDSGAGGDGRVAVVAGIVGTRTTGIHTDQLLGHRDLVHVSP